MNVGIQETDHFEAAYPVIRLFDNGHNRLFLFVTREMHRRLKDLLGDDAGRYHWIIQEDGQSTYSFCRKIAGTIRKHSIEILYLNTVSKHHLWYGLLIPFRKELQSILTVHDVNCLFRDTAGWSVRKLAKWLGKKLLTRRVSAFNTISETVRPHLEKQVMPGQAVYTIPGAVYENRKTCPAKTHNPLKIVIPGSIDNKRRDYHQVFDLLLLIPGLPVSILLLGGGENAYSRQVWKQCRETKDNRLQWFETRVVDQQHFDSLLDEADFIWIPTVVETTICDNIPEVYGITKSSGNLFDIIKHAKPFIYPRSLLVPDGLTASGYAYGCLENIANFLTEVLQQPSIAEVMQEAAIASSLEYTVETLRSKFSPLFD